MSKVVKINDELKNHILKDLSIEESLLELRKIHTEIGVNLMLGTVIKGELEPMYKRESELVCIIEYLKILKGE